MLIENQDVLPELEWMIQSSQVDDALLLEALKERYFSALFHFASYLQKDQAASLRSAYRAIHHAVVQRHRYTGEIRLKTWLLSLVYRYSRGSKLSGVLRRQPSFTVIREDSARWSCEKKFGQAAAVWDGLTSLTGPQRLVLLLCYVYDLAQIEAAVVLETSLVKITVPFDQARQKIASLVKEFQGEPACSSGPDDHLEIQYQCRLAAAHRLEPHCLAELDLHLSGCSVCRIYMAKQAAFEADLTRWIKELWSPADINYEDLLLGFEGGKKKRLKSWLPAVFRRRCFSVTETSLSVVLVAVLTGMSWIGMTYSTLPRPTPVSKDAPVVVILPVTATPYIIYQVAEPVSVSGSGRQKNHPAQILDEVEPVFMLEIPVLELNPATYTSSANRSRSGPVALAGVLDYWGWDGSLDEIIDSLQPNHLDETVMPYELEDFVSRSNGEDGTSQLKSIYRMGGSLLLLQQLVKAGFPVIIQEGLIDPDGRGWFSHYQIVCGFDEDKSTFDVLPSPLIADGVGNSHISNLELQRSWQAFNYAFLVVYSPAKENELNPLLGSYVSMSYAAGQAALTASEEIFSSSGTDLFFAWFNRGTSLAYLDDYGGAAAAYDQAFSLLDRLPPADRPWRILWYQTRPYWAYYYTHRYEDFIEFSTNMIISNQSPVLEESLYWRGLAKEALGDIQGAIVDLERSLQVNPKFSAGQVQLKRLAPGT